MTDERAPLQPGLYERVVTEQLAQSLAALPKDMVQRDGFDHTQAPDLLSRHLAGLIRRALRSVGEREDTAADQIGRQLEAANRIAALAAEIAPSIVEPQELLDASGELLLAIAREPGLPGQNVFPIRPEIPLSASRLLDNRSSPRIGTELRREFASADRVDLICAFLKSSGLNVIKGPLTAFLQRGGRLRIITTTYMGATDARAVQDLALLGAQIRVSYDTLTTRLHAKAWCFHRDSGYTTAYVGSSNLSKAALADGNEWNVRLSSVEAPHLIDAFADNFEHYWAEDGTYELYDPETDRDRLARALADERTGPSELPLRLTSLEVRPWRYQQEVLDELAAEREVHGRHRNLVVMATGTGKTIVAALDYQRLRTQGVDSLLFIAHRQEILEKSLDTYRQVLGRSDFGELFVNGSRPATWRHVFASVQSLATVDLDSVLHPQRFDMIVVDEFHHAQAPTYARLLDHVDPKILLGLTATPERGDGADITHWFGGRIAVDLRLWEAIERGMLVPFQYFGISDGTDLRAVRFSRTSDYDTTALSNLYTGDDARVRIVLNSLAERVTDVRSMRALGFCVSIAHAEFMAARFNEAGIRALAVTSKTAHRNQTLTKLADREVNILFTVDLFNEGVDLPGIDTVLFLRPTQSATVFLQQLGRGLRRAPDKGCLTVLDFIGLAHENFRFDVTYRALTGGSRSKAAQEIEYGFPALPPGCHAELDAVAQNIVLDNIRRTLRTTWRHRVTDLRELADVPLAAYLRETGTELEDVYRGANGTWTALREQAGLPVDPPGPHDSLLEGTLRRLLHVDDVERLTTLERLAAGTFTVDGERSRRLYAMASCLLWNKGEPIGDLRDERRRAAELLELIPILHERIHRAGAPLDRNGANPLRLHARYTKDEAQAAFGVAKPEYLREGVKWVEREKSDLFFVTLIKSAQHYSESTRYQDRVITPSLFQWESQSGITTSSPTGQRYVNHVNMGTSVHLFLRETRAADGKLGVPPYLYAGRMTYLQHTGDKPMRIRWHLDTALPGDVVTSSLRAAA